MKRQLQLLAAVAFLATSQGGPAAPDTDPHCAPEFVTAARRAWTKSGIGMVNTEAGFWVYQINGETRYLDLPKTNQNAEITITAMPPRASALFHTHPNSKLPQPSANDIAVADRLNLTIYSGSSRGLWAHDPGSPRSSVVRPSLTWTQPCKD